MTELEEAIEGLSQVILHLDVMRQISSGKDELRYRELRDYAEDALELLKARQWVSVKDKLPSYAELKAEEVLVLLDDGCICVSHYDECIDDGSIFGEWQQYYDPQTLGTLDSEWIPLEGVTHWAMLPEPPKEGEDDA